jgi:hypothetical protein
MIAKTSGDRLPGMDFSAGYIDAIADAEAWRMAAVKAITIPDTDQTALAGLHAQALGILNSSEWLVALRSNPAVSNVDIEAARLLLKQVAL